MTQQYIVGELSSLLDELGRADGDELRDRVDELRHRVETSPRRHLPRLAGQALDLADAACIASLERGDVAGFCRCACATLALGEFAQGAGLLP